MIEDPKHLIAIIAKYIPPTTCKGSRVKLTLPRFGIKKFIPYDYSHNSANGIALSWLKEKGICVTHEADGVELGSILLADFSQVDHILATFGK
jgi:hypothetical protein